MAYRAVGKDDVLEALRLYVRGTPKRRIAAQLRLDPKTVRRYVAAAERHGITVGSTLEPDDPAVVGTLAELAEMPGRPHGDSWKHCEVHRAKIDALLTGGHPLAGVRRALAREGVDVPYATLHRFAVTELGFVRPETRTPPPGSVAMTVERLTTFLRDAIGRPRRATVVLFTTCGTGLRFGVLVAEPNLSALERACDRAAQFFGRYPRTVVVPLDTFRPSAEGPTPADALREHATRRGYEVISGPKAPILPRVERAMLERALLSNGRADFASAATRIDAYFRQRAEDRSDADASPRQRFEEQEASAFAPLPDEAADDSAWLAPTVEDSPLVM